jgi:hypothetical protein
MNRAPIHVVVYTRLTALYPSAFRDGYRADLVAMFAEQLRDEAPARVWARTLRDLTVTVPAQHLETRMHGRWKFLVAGVMLAGLTFTAIAIPWPDEIDLGDGAYWLA